MGASWGPFGASWGLFGAECSKCPFGFPVWVSTWGRPGVLSGVLGAFGAVLGPYWAVLEPFWGPLGLS